ncbi:MAG: twin-arginine translocase subunit TatC [Planctomycetes bacterium]|nr:twin-arginine translocase subunit TatC [Planctomycetota bacterium]
MEETPAPFSSHLVELRRRLIWALAGVFVAFSVVFGLWADDIVRYIQGIAVIERVVDGETVQVPIQFAVINPLETFSTTARVSFYAALVFAYPWCMMQLYWFVAPGLYRHERRFFQVAIPSIFVLFAAGAAFGRYVLLPISIPFLLDFNVQDFHVQQNYALDQFLGLVFALTAGLGFVFQIPLVVAPLIRFGLVSAAFFRGKRRYTVMVSIIVGAIISPTGSPIDMLIAGAPVFVLIEGGVALGSLWRNRALKAAEKEAVAAAERGETVDPEALAGGLADDLSKRLKDLANGGARDMARQLMLGLREGKDEVARNIFDDQFTDDDKPATEVKLKPRAAQSKPEPEAAGVRPDQAFAPAVPAARTQEPAPKAADAPAGPTPAAPATEGARPAPGAEAPAAETAVAQAPATNEEDRPWHAGVDENLARCIDDRISQRLDQFMEQELRPWMERIEHELMKRNGGNGRT